MKRGSVPLAVNNRHRFAILLFSRHVFSVDLGLFCTCYKHRTFIHKRDDPVLMLERNYCNSRGDQGY